MDSTKWAGVNSVGNALLFLLLFASGTLLVFKSRKGITTKIVSWKENMKMPAVPEEPVLQATKTSKHQESQENE